MKCLSCDEILSDREAVRKYPNGEYLDLCDLCYNEIREYTIDYDYDEERIVLPPTRTLP